DAEDAFQAAFLVLARHATSIRKPESMRSWLHGVAYRVALRAKSDATRRRIHEHRVGDLTQPSPLDDLTWRELRLALHEELQRLPERYRLPLLLCYFEGKTQEEAAHLLGWSTTTLKGRLTHGRERLSGRFISRGLPLSAGLVAT